MKSYFYILSYFHLCVSYKLANKVYRLSHADTIDNDYHSEKNISFHYSTLLLDKLKIKIFCEYNWSP
jgi:hypothetical protein